MKDYCVFDGIVSRCTWAKLWAYEYYRPARRGYISSRDNAYHGRITRK